MEEEEARPAVGRRAVARVQARDAGGRRREKLARPPACVSAGGVDPVREQREAQLAVRVGEIVHLELLDLLLDLGLAGQQRRTTTSVRSSAGTPSRSSSFGQWARPDRA